MSHITHHTISNTRIFQNVCRTSNNLLHQDFPKCMSHIFITKDFLKCMSHIITESPTPGFSKMYVTHYTISFTRIFQKYVTHFHNLGFSEMYVTHHHRISNIRIFQNICHTSHNLIHQDFPNVCHTFS